ncbi:MAG: sulfite exporter TauE/SafE family protein, partial [Actinomycetota bacterium]
LIAVGSTLPSILPSAISGTLRYRREDLIDWRAVGWTVPAGIVAAVVGALLSKVVPGEGRLLQLATAGLLGLSAWRMARGGRRTDEEVTATEATDHRGAFTAVGSLAGLLSGLLGIGGGVVMVPGFTQLTGMPVKRAIATSLACVGLFSIPGMITHAFLGNIDWRFALLLAVGVVPGARLGAAATIASDDRRVRLVVAGFLAVTAVIYAVGELLAL